MVEKLEGIILSSQDYKENSKIINIFTKKYGIISAIAKGCKSLKSNLRSCTDKLTYGYFHIYYKQNKLSILSAVDIIDNFKLIKKDINKIVFSTYLLDLASQVTKQNNKQDIYDILINGLIKINENYDPLVIMNIIELKYLDYLGVMPVIDACCKCGKTTSICTLSSYAGGYLCNSCRTNEKIVSDKTIKLLRMFYYIDISKISKIEISKEAKNEINKFLDEYYDRYTGLYLKSKNFLGTLEKLN